MGLFKGLGNVEENNRIAKFAGLGLFNGKGWEEDTYFGVLEAEAHLRL